MTFSFLQIYQAMVLIQRRGMVDTHTYAKINLSKQCQTGTQIIYKVFECLFIHVYAIIK